MSRAHRLAGLCLAATAGLSACTEPVDCNAEPSRCLVQPGRAKPPVVQVVAPEGVPATRPDDAQPVPRPVRRRDAREGAAQVGEAPSQRYLPMPRGPGLAVLPPGQPAGVQPAQAEAGAAADESPEQLLTRGIVAKIREPAKAHDIKALMPHMTKRLAGDLEPKMAQYGERFWRHLDAYVRAAEGGFRVQSEPGDAPTRRQATLTLPDGQELKPILEREDNMWKIDRF